MKDANLRVWNLAQVSSLFYMVHMFCFCQRLLEAHMEIYDPLVGVYRLKQTNNTPRYSEMNTAD